MVIRRSETIITAVYLMLIFLATKNKVATAATNGTIIIWDINKIGRKAGSPSLKKDRKVQLNNVFVK